MASRTWAISLGVLVGAAVLVVTACESPPEPKAVTDAEPALSETVLSEDEKHDELRSGEHEIEFVDLEQMAAGDPTATAAPEVETGPTAQVVEQPVTEPEQEEEVGIERTGIYDRHYGAAVASIEERIFLSDAIVRATLVSAANDILTFTAVEYLKGGGSTQFTVSAATANRNTRWDDQEAILFLSQPASSPAKIENAAFEFADTTSVDYRPQRPVTYSGSLNRGYTIDAHNAVWLPSDSRSGARGRSEDAKEYITASYSVSGASEPTISLGDLKDKIAWVQGGDGIKGYSKCILYSLSHIRNYRDWEAYHGEPRPLVLQEQAFESGVAAGTEVGDLSKHEITSYDIYGRRWVTGEDADAVAVVIEDDDSIARNGYFQKYVIARPLIAGTYEAIGRSQNPYYMPCNYEPPFNRVGIKLIVTAPEGTVWEAFFDPNATGFDSDGGELSPATFTANEKTSTITALSYENGKVMLETDPFNSLSGLHLHLIKLDGTIDVALPGNSATQDEASKRLTWDVPYAPWADGDRLMLRLTTVALPNRPP